MLGYSLNSVDKEELDQARTILLDVAPHLFALDSDKYGQDRWPRTAERLTLGWTGPLGRSCKDDARHGRLYIVPSEGTLFWLDTWVMHRRRAEPQRGLRLA